VRSQPTKPVRLKTLKLERWTAAAAIAIRVKAATIVTKAANNVELSEWMQQRMRLIVLSRLCLLRASSSRVAAVVALCVPRGFPRIHFSVTLQ